MKLSLTLALLFFSSAAGASEFKTGPIFIDYGRNAVIEGGLPSPDKQRMKVMFDISDTADSGALNRSFDSVARFINMHVRAGVPFENIEAAIVVHGKASFDLTSDAAYQEEFNSNNPSGELISALLEKNVKIFICGQSAAYNEILNEDLIPGVSMSLSAMTAGALLQQQGYTLNAF